MGLEFICLSLYYSDHRPERRRRFRSNEASVRFVVVKHVYRVRAFPCRKTEIRFPAECTDRKIIPFRAGKVLQNEKLLFLIILPIVPRLSAKFHRYRIPRKVFLFNEATHFHPPHLSLSRSRGFSIGNSIDLRNFLHSVASNKRNFTHYALNDQSSFDPQLLLTISPLSFVYPRRNYEETWQILLVSRALSILHNNSELIANRLAFP